MEHDVVRIGTFFGSTDSKNCSEKFLKIFSQNEFRNFKFISILGKNNKKKNRITKMFKEKRNFYIEKNFVNIKNFFRKIDILISAGGVTSFEALSSNIKCINVPITFYQKKSSNFQKTNKIADVFNYNKIFSRNGKKILIDCIKKISKKKNSISRKKYLDNLGSKRIANYISQKLLT